MAITVRFQIGGHNAADWTGGNPTLLAREYAAELDTGKFKIGDGATAWNSLPYITFWSSFARLGGAVSDNAALTTALAAKVAGPASATDNHVVLFDGTTGKLVKDSGVAPYTDELAQDAIGAMVDSSLVYADATPLLSRAALSGDAIASQGSNAVTVVKINGVALSGLATGILKNTTATGVPSIAVAGDFPTLNQNTTGSAATLTTSRNFSISGGGITASAVGFNGSAAVALNASVDAGHITLARMADLATDRLIGRDTAGTGVPESLTVGGGIEFTGSGGIQTSAFTGDATKAAGGTATTLATVNSNVGSFGSATQVATFTVNAKGLTTAAANVTITPAASSITGGQALTKVDDTNVTLTLGGTPATALLQAASITVGWTGTLAAGRGGTGVSSLGSITKTDDTNVTLTLGGTPTGAVITSTSFTLGWTGILAASRGGTANGFTAFSGPTTSTKTFTLPDASDTIACLGQVNAFTQRQTISNNVAGQSAWSATGLAGRYFVDLNGSGINVSDAADHRFRSFAGTTLFLQITSAMADFSVPIRRAGTQVVNTRKTGWAVATGTATRTTFDTTTVTLAQLAERVKALIDDLHATAGHGLIGT